MSSYHGSADEHVACLWLRRTPRYGDWVGHEIRQAVQQETMPYPAEHLSPVPSESKGKQAAHVRGHSKASSVAGSISSAAAPHSGQPLPARLHSDKAGANVKKTDAPTEDCKTDAATASATPAARSVLARGPLLFACLWLVDVAYLLRISPMRISAFCISLSYWSVAPLAFLCIDLCCSSVAGAA